MNRVLNFVLKLVGVVLILAGIAAGLYFGFWITFIGGIVTIVEGIKANPTSAGLIAWGLAKMFVLTPIVWALAFRTLVRWGASCIDAANDV